MAICISQHIYIMVCTLAAYGADAACLHDITLLFAGVP